MAGKSSGKSKSSENPNGKRRVVGGKELSPRSLRKQKKYMTELSDKDLEKAQISR